MKKKRKCSVCDSTEHRADYHGSKRERAAQGKMPELPPDVAMRTMIDPFYAVWLVSEGSVGEALANATRGLAEARKAGITVGDTMLQALAELELRARDLSPVLLVEVRALRQKLDAAQSEYSAAAKKITDHLGYGRKDK